MMVVGLTGSIAVGKSEVAYVLASHGIPVFDADAAVHELYAKREVADEVARSFPFAVADGTVSRQQLSSHLQTKPQDFALLEAIVHPRVRRMMMEFLALHRSRAAELAVVDVPLLFETGGDRIVDRVLLVTAPAGMQREWALKRPGMTEKKLEAILARQLSQEAKARRADYIVDNSGSLPELKAKVRALMYDLTAEARNGKP
jgi:dephospho-CoA kinase